jgi:hypothetical protein
MKSAQIRSSVTAAAIAFALALAAPVAAEQESPMIKVLPGCPVVIASVDVVPAGTDTFGVRHFAIQAMVGGTSKSSDAYIGVVSYVIYDSTGPKPFMGSTDVVPSMLNIDGFLKFTIADFAENYRHHIVGKPIAAVSLSCTKLPDALFTWQQKKFGEK